MPEPRQFGPLIFIAAEAIGQPGQRRFRLKAMNEEHETAFLWLEKEQVAALGEAIENVLSGEDYEYTRLPEEEIEEPVFPLNANVEFRLGQLSMGVDRENHQVVLIASDGPDVEEDSQSVNMTFDFRIGYELRRQILGVVSAGRPPCPLCTAPMDPAGHVCVRTNGHNPH